MDSKIKVPRALKAKLMLWSAISHHDMELIDQMQSIPDLERALCSVLGVDLPEPRRQVLLELLAQAVLFCREHSFKKEQTSALLSIIKSIHEANIETPLNNLDQCLEYSRELLLCHSVSRPPYSINLFSFEESNSILKYIHNNYLRHHKLYKYMFTPQVKADLSLTYSGMEEHRSSVSEGSSEPGPSADVKKVEKEAEPMTDESSEMQEASTTEQMGTSTVSVELKAMIEREDSQQIKLVSEQLNEYIRELTSQGSSTSNSPQPPE